MTAAALAPPRRFCRRITSRPCGAGSSPPLRSSLSMLRSSFGSAHPRLAPGRRASGGDHDRACAGRCRAANGDAHRDHAGPANDRGAARGDRGAAGGSGAGASRRSQAQCRLDDAAQAETEAEENHKGRAEAGGEADPRAAGAAHQRAPPRGGGGTGGRLACAERGGGGGLARVPGRRR